MKNKNFIIVRIMEGDVCIHAHEISRIDDNLDKYTKYSYPNEAGGKTTIIEIQAK